MKNSTLIIVTLFISIIANGQIPTYPGINKAKNGNAYEQYLAYYWYAGGAGLQYKHDFVKAIYWLEKACEQKKDIYRSSGEKISYIEINKLLRSYYCGNNTSEILSFPNLSYPESVRASKKVFENYIDKEKCFSLTKIAADKNDTESQYDLAEMYLNGVGTYKDINNAVIYLQKAEKAGHKEAAKLLSRIKIDQYLSKVRSKASSNISNQINHSLPLVNMQNALGDVVSSNKIVNNGKPILILYFGYFVDNGCCVKLYNSINENYKYWQEQTGVKIYGIIKGIYRKDALSIIARNDWEFEILFDTDESLKEELEFKNSPRFFVLTGTGRIYENIFQANIVGNNGIENEIFNTLKEIPKIPLENGEWKEYYENKQLKEEGHYSNYEKTGIWKYYFENGRIKATGEYIHGKMNGEWKYYFENGEIELETNYVDNEGNGQTKLYYENGILRMEGTRIGNKIVGVCKFYHDTGKLESKGSLNYNGNKTGIWVTYHENGSVYTEKEYEDGKLLKIISCKDGKGNKLKKGSLKKGNGTVRNYDENGIFLGEDIYKDGVLQE